MNPSALIDKEIANHPDWRGETMAEIRRIIRTTVPDVTEEWKMDGHAHVEPQRHPLICNALKDMVKGWSCSSWRRQRRAVSRRMLLSAQDISQRSTRLGGPESWTRPNV
jgi:hypothetical protein